MNDQISTQMVEAHNIATMEPTREDIEKVRATDPKEVAIQTPEVLGEEPTTPVVM